jgi:hypothetical protein
MTEMEVLYLIKRKEVEYIIKLKMVFNVILIAVGVSPEEVNHKLV